MPRAYAWLYSGFGTRRVFVGKSDDVGLSSTWGRIVEPIRLPLDGLGISFWINHRIWSVVLDSVTLAFPSQCFQHALQSRALGIAI